jgi:hypothetical protein
MTGGEHEEFIIVKSVVGESDQGFVAAAVMPTQPYTRKYRNAPVQDALQVSEGCGAAGVRA